MTLISCCLDLKYHAIPDPIISTLGINADFRLISQSLGCRQIVDTNAAAKTVRRRPGRSL